MTSLLISNTLYGAGCEISINFLKRLTNLTQLELRDCLYHFSFNDNFSRYLPQLKSLTLYDNEEVTNDTIKNLTNLTSLSLDQPSISTRYNFSRFTNLTYLSAPGIKSRDLVVLTNLSHLVIRAPLKVFDRDFSHLQKLTKLELLHGKETSDTILRLLPNLQEIAFSDRSCNIQRTSKNVITLTKVTCLSVLKLDEIRLLPILEHFPNLIALHLPECTIEMGSELVISKLMNLRILYLQNARSFPNYILGSLTNLVKLNLSIPIDEERDGAIENLTSLTILDISENSDVTNKAIKNLCNLTSLNIAKNSFVDDHGLVRLTNLRILDATKNHYISFSGISKLRNLNSLSISYHRSFRFENLCLLSHLTSLKCRDTQLSLLERKKLTHIRNLCIESDPGVRDESISSSKSSSLSSFSSFSSSSFSSDSDNDNSMDDHFYDLTSSSEVSLTISNSTFDDSDNEGGSYDF